MLNLSVKKLSFKKFCLSLLFIYILSLFVLDYHENLYILSDILLVVFLITTAIYALLRHKIQFDFMHFALFILCVLAFIISYSRAIDLTMANSRNITLIQLTIMVVFIRTILDDRIYIEKILKAVYISGLLMCIYAIYFYGISGILNALITGNELGAEINQGNSFGYYSSITLIIGLYYAIFKREKIYYFVSFIPLILALSSGSRRAILIVVAGVLLMLLFKNPKKQIRNLILISLSLFIAYFCISTFPIFENLYLKINSLIYIFADDTISDNSLFLRKGMWEYGWQLFCDKPLFGYGTEQFRIYYGNYFGIERAPHSTYIQIATSFGLLGFFLYYGMYIVVLRSIIRGVKSRDNVAVVLLTLLFILLISDLAANNLFSKINFILIAVFFAYRKINILDGKT